MKNIIRLKKMDLNFENPNLLSNYCIFAGETSERHGKQVTPVTFASFGKHINDANDGLWDDWNPDVLVSEWPHEPVYMLYGPGLYVDNWFYGKFFQTTPYEDKVEVKESSKRGERLVLEMDSTHLVQLYQSNKILECLPEDSELGSDDMTKLLEYSLNVHQSYLRLATANLQMREEFDTFSEFGVKKAAKKINLRDYFDLGLLEKLEELPRDSNDREIPLNVPVQLVVMD